MAGSNSYLKKYSDLMPGDVIRIGDSSKLGIVWIRWHEQNKPLVIKVLDVVPIAKGISIEIDDDNDVVRTGYLKAKAGLNSRDDYHVKIKPQDIAEDQCTIRDLAGEVFCFGSIANTSFFDDLENNLRAKINRGDLVLSNTPPRKHRRKIAQTLAEDRRAVRLASGGVTKKMPVLDVTLEDAQKIGLIDEVTVRIVEAGLPLGAEKPRLRALYNAASADDLDARARFGAMVKAGVDSTNIDLMAAFNAGLLQDSKVIKALGAKGITTLGPAMDAAYDTSIKMKNNYRLDLAGTPIRRVRENLCTAWDNLKTMLADRDQALVGGEIKHMYEPI